MRRHLRFRLGNAQWILAPSRDVRHVRDADTARRVVRELLAAGSVSLRALGIDEDAEGLEDRLVHALTSGQLRLLALEEEPRRLSAPRIVELASLAEPPEAVVEPPRPTAWVGIQVVDQRGRPVPLFDVEVRDPVGKHHRLMLDPAARASVDKLADDGGCTVTLTPKGNA